MLTKLFPAATSRMLDADGTRLYCVEMGSGPPLVLVGGWPQSAHCWRHVFGELARTRRVIAIDPPGLGDSDKPAPVYDIEGVARTVGAAIDRLQLGRYDFVGFDIGMWIAYPLGLARAAEIRTLTMIDARIPGIVPFPPFNPQAAIVSWHFAFNFLPELPEVLIEGRERAFLKWLFESRTPTPGVFSDADLDEYARVYQGRPAITSAVGYYRALPQSIAEVERLKQGPKLAMPVLAIAGDKGVGSTMTASLEQVCADLRGLTFEGCGHYVPEEQPRRLLEELHRFLPAA